MAKKKASSKKIEFDKISFEDGLEKLDDVVQRLESEQLTLEEMVSSYENGVHLLRACERRLKDAEHRIEVLQDQGIDDEQSGTTPKPETSDDSTTPRKSKADDDEIRLF